MDFGVKMIFMAIGQFPEMMGHITLDGEVVGKFERAAVTDGIIPEIEIEFYDEEHKIIFATFAGELSMQETIEAMI